MNVVFLEEALAEMYERGKTKSRKYKTLCKNKKFIRNYQRIVSVMIDIGSTEELCHISYMHYEKLKYQKEALSSVRIVNGMVERLLFREDSDGIKVELIEIDNTHYGNKK